MDTVRVFALWIVKRCFGVRPRATKSLIRSSDACQRWAAKSSRWCGGCAPPALRLKNRGMPPKQNLSAAKITRLSQLALHDQCVAWGVPTPPKARDLKLRGLLDEKIADYLAGASE